MVAFNFVFRVISTQLIERLKFRTVSREAVFLMTFVFGLTFFNTALQISFDNWSTVEFIDSPDSLTGLIFYKV